jgi:class 3 adenylate cyclase
MVVTFDPRGTGLSDRDVGDFSLYARLLDVATVVDQLGLDKFALHGIWQSGAVAIAYAARYPERVSHVILDDAFAGAQASMQTPQSRAFRELSGDWEAITEHIAFTFAGLGGADARRYAEFMRSCTSHENALKMWTAFGRVDVRDLLPQIAAPTLVLQHTGIKGMGADTAREMAALIPDANLTLLEGKEEDDLDQLLSTLGDFLGDKTAPGALVATASAVILFTDIADSTELTERMGDAAFRDASRALDLGLRAAIRDAGGVAVEGKLLGDGVLATFPSAAQAIEGARRCLALSSASELGLHIGLHAGDVIREDNNVFGGAVNIAARICGLSAPGEILVSDVVRGMARSSAGVEFTDRGEQEMKGVGEPVRLYEVRWRE